MFNFDKFAKDVLDEIGEILVDGAKKNMDKKSIGRTYIINGRKHIASREGDAPNNMTGKLKSTIRYEIDGRILEFGAGNEKVNYAKYLERGTRKMGARPNYTKTIMEHKGELDVKIERLFRKALNELH